MIWSNCAAVIVKSPTVTTTRSGGTTGMVLGAGFSTDMVTVGLGAGAGWGGGACASSHAAGENRSRMRSNVICS